MPPTAHPTFSPSPPALSPSTPLPHRRLPPGQIHTHDPHAAPPSPIIARMPEDEGPATSAVPPSPHPQYAEDLTPLKLRHKRRKHVALPSFMSALPLTPGVSKLGWMTEEGEVYRGAMHDPRSDTATIEEDAITISASSSSSSSGWSLPSAVERTFERFGEVIGVRRGSHSTDDTSSTSSSSTRSGVFRRRSRRLSRSTTRGSSPERPKRQHLPRKREFTLLLPPKEGTALSRVSTEQSSIESPPSSNASYPHDRLVVTPSLPIVLDKIRSLRAISGIRVDVPVLGPDVPVRRGGSAPGRTRQKSRSGHQATFGNPAFSRPLNPRTQSRLQALRTHSSNNVPRPKSVSDLMGMANPYASTPTLTSLKNIDFKLPSRADTLDSAPSSDVLAKQKAKATPCWWLDVACPAWEDLRDIGELLGLHPLTLEDVLHQDPREKLDTFVKLGYYFVVVRALDEGYFKYTPGAATTLVGKGQTVVMDSPASPELAAGNNEKTKEGRRRGWGMGRASGRNAHKEGEKVEIVEDNPGKEGLEGVGVGALNVYLVVFADGIVSFHYDDVSKHTKRVLDRILSSTSIKAAPGADWVAHGLLDSIVDAFFPLIRYVDGEVDDIDSLTIDPSADPKAQTATRAPSPASSLTQVASLSSGDIELLEKGAVIHSEPVEPWITRFWCNVNSMIPRYTIHLPRPLQYVGLFLLPTMSAVHRHYDHPDDKTQDRAAMVYHITSMRKLVTGLTRLLGAKGQVVGEIRKRAISSGEGVDAYMGDVEDHILLLQNSLYHYEYILSHCQPAYLSHINVSFKIAKGQTDKAILALSVITIGILPIQLVSSAMGMNVRVPHNGLQDDPAHRADGSVSPLSWFFGIVGFILLLICGLVSTIRYWRWAARKKWGRRRNRDLPSDWDGYWGWR